MSNLKEGLFNLLRKRGGKSEPPKTDGRQRSGGPHKTDAPPKPNKKTVELDTARRTWEQKSNPARRQLDELTKRPLRDGRQPQAILNTAQQFADRATKDGYEKGATLIDKVFVPALELAEKNGQELQGLRDKVNDEIVALEKDAEVIGRSDGLDNFLNDARSRLTNATTVKEMTAVRRMLKRAPLFRPLPEQVNGDGDQKFLELQQTEWAEVEKGDAKKAWESAHEEALDVCDELKALEPYCQVQPAQDLLKRAEEKAKEDSARGYKDAAALIEKEFKPLTVEARKTAVATIEARREAQDALRRAEVDLGKVETLDGFADKVNEAADLFKNADQAWFDARTAEGFRQVLPLAKTVQEKIDAILEEAKPLLEAEKRFDAALRDARKVRQEVSVLPMADSYDAISGPLADINEAVIEAANIVAGGPRSLQTVNAGLEKLKPVQAKRKEAVRAAKEVAGEIEGVRRRQEQVAADLEDLKKYQFIKDQAGTAEKLLKQAGDELDGAADLAAVEQAKKTLDQASGEAKRLARANEQKLKFARAAEAEGVTARSAVEGMKKLPHADQFGPLIRLIDRSSGELDRVQNSVVKAKDIEGLRRAAEEFQRVAGRATEGAELSSKAGEISGKLLAADKLVAGVERHGFFKVAAAKLRDDVAKAEEGFHTSTTLDAAVKAAAPLDGIEQKVKDLKKPKDKNERKEVENKLEERKKYDELRTEAVTRIGEARKLRGVEADEQMKNLIQEMDKILEKADGMVGKALTKEAVENAGLEFDGLKPLKERAEKRAEVLKKEHEANLKARQRYQKTLAKAELAARKAAAGPGGSEFAEQIRRLVNGARLAVEHDPEGGHGKALAPLEDKATGYEALLKKAEQAGKDFKPDPAVAQKRKEVEGMLDIFAKVASEDAALLYRGEVAAALEKSVKDADGAVIDLERIASDMKKDAARLGVVEKEARKALDELERQIAAIKSFAPQETVKRAETAVLRAKEEIAARDWSAARDRLDAAVQEAKGWADRKGDAEEWGNKQADLQRMIDRCKVVAAAWPPLAGPADELRGELTALQGEVARSGDFKKALTELAKLEQSFGEFEKDVKGQIPSQQGGASIDLAELDKARSEGWTRVRAARGEAEVALGEFSRLPTLVGARNTEKIPVFVKYKEIEEAWTTFLDNVGEGGAVSADAIRKGADKAVKDYGDLKARLTKAGKDNLALMLELKDVVKDIEQADDGERRERLEGKLTELERHGADATAWRGRVRAAFEKTPADAKEVKKLEEDLNGRLKQLKEEMDRDMAQGRKKADEFRKQFAKVPITKRKFKEYFRKLTDRVDDIDALLQSGDPDLVRKGMEDLKAMEEVAKRNHGDYWGKRFKPVRAMWKKMGATLGEGNLVRKRLKETYNRLRKELEAAIAKAMETEPEQALKDLEPLSKKIDAARKEAERVDARYKEFKAAHEAVAELHKKLTKETRTWITEKCEAYTKLFETRMAAAKRLAKAEGSLEQGFAELEKVRNELEEIRSKPNPREELQKRNGQAAQDQRMVRDLARQFEAEKAGFEKLCDKVEEEMKKAKKDKDNKGQVIQIRQLTRLRRAADGAAKGVEPYTKTISKQDADPPEEVLNAFTQARKQLSELTESARRLIEEPASTEVADPDELAAIEKEFRSRCRKLTAGVEDLVGKVKEASQQAGTWPAVDKAPTENEVRETVSKLEKYFSDVGDRFTAKRLAAPLKVLKESQDKNARKSAREKALREIHRNVQELLRDDVLRELRNNPYRKLTAETSLLRASLKSLELAALVGV